MPARFEAQSPFSSCTTLLVMIVLLLQHLVSGRAIR